jgi:protein-tyrosine phosphatase
MRRLAVLALLLLVVAVPAMAVDQSDRLYMLVKARNIHSLGGYPVSDGVIKEATIYRSGRLTHLSKADAETLQQLHLNTIIEMRNHYETVWEGPDSPSFTRTVPHYLHIPLPIDHDLNRSIYYHNVVSRKRWHKPIKQFFDVLADSNSYPLLYHCTLGYDRSGILTALLLSALGTPRDYIYQDFLAAGGKGVTKSNMTAVFRAIDEAGGIRPLLHSMSVSDAEIQKIHDNLVVVKPQVLPAQPTHPGGNEKPGQ